MGGYIESLRGILGVRLYTLNPWVMKGDTRTLDYSSRSIEGQKCGPVLQTCHRAIGGGRQNQMRVVLSSDWEVHFPKP